MSTQHTPLAKVLKGTYVTYGFRIVPYPLELLSSTDLVPRMEMNTIIICACIPSFRLLFRRDASQQGDHSRNTLTADNAQLYLQPKTELPADERGELEAIREPTEVMGSGVIIELAGQERACEMQVEEHRRRQELRGDESARELDTAY